MLIFLPFSSRKIVGSGRGVFILLPSRDSGTSKAGPRVESVGRPLSPAQNPVPAHHSTPIKDRAGASIERLPPSSSIIFSGTFAVKRRWPPVRPPALIPFGAKIGDDPSP